MHGNEAKDVQWETVDGGQRIPPFTDGCRSGQDVFGELKKLKKIVFRAPEEPSTFNVLTVSLEPGPRSNCDDQSYVVVPWEDQLTTENTSYSSIQH